MVASFRLGYAGKIYYATLTAGGAATAIDDDTLEFDDATVTWVEFANVMDVDDQFDSDSIDTTTRAEAALGWASEVNTTKKGQYSFTMRWQPGYAAFNALRDSWLGNTEIGLLNMDGPFGTAADEGNQGLAGNFTVSFSRKQPVKGIMTVDVTAKLSSYPTWVEVDSGGNLVAVVV